MKQETKHTKKNHVAQGRRVSRAERGAKSAGIPEAREVESLLNNLLRHGFGRIEIVVSYGEVKEISMTMKALPETILQPVIVLDSGTSLHIA